MISSSRKLFWHYPIAIIRHIRRLAKRIARTFSGPLVEFPEKFLYEHCEAMCVFG